MQTIQASDLKMVDVSVKASTCWSLQDEQAADTSIGDFRKDNGGKDCPSSVEMGDPPELLISEINSQRMEKDEASSGKDHAQMQAEADQSDVADLNGNTLLYGNSQKSGEESVDANSPQECSPSSKTSQECEHQIFDTTEKSLNVLPLQVSLSIPESPASEDHDEINHDLSIRLSGDLRAVSSEHKVEVEIANEHLPSKILIDNEKTELVNLEEKRDGFAEALESTNESNTGSMPPCSVSSIPEGILPRDFSHPPHFPSVSDSGQQQSQANNKFVGDTEILSPSTSAGNGEGNVGFQNEMDSFLDPNNQEWSDLDFGEATVISTDIEGWQRFDTEGVVTAQYSDPGVRWEQLLDDGLDNIEKNDVVTPLQLVLPPTSTENRSELASPGNPFIEGLERVSSFSETDGFAHSKDLPHSDKLSQGVEDPSSLHLEEGLIDEKAHCDPSSGMTTTREAEKNAVQSSVTNEAKSKLHLKSSASLDFMEPFEAPSFMSLVDPKSHALFEASMPTYQAKQSGYGHESGEEQWVANFDLVAPSTQEITRSISMPRSGSDTPGERPGQSVSFTVNREQEAGKKENQSPSVHRSISGFLSPKVSPLVQKVVDKVRSTPAAANGVINSVRHVMSPKASGRKSGSGSLLTRCMCW